MKDYNDGKELIKAVNTQQLLTKITAPEALNLRMSVFDVIDKKRMDDDTWFRTNGKVSGKQILFY